MVKIPNICFAISCRYFFAKYYISKITDFFSSFFMRGERHLKMNDPISCDNCDKMIVGIRYKCLHCYDFYLCEKCEMQRLHSEHSMIRLVSTSKHKVESKSESVEDLGEQFENYVTKMFEQEREHQRQMQKILNLHQEQINRLNKQHNAEIKLLEDRIISMQKHIEMHQQNYDLIMENILLPQKMFLSYLKEKPLQPISSRKSLDRAIESARKKHGIDIENFFNYGFAGHTKTGKSSVINAIRGLRAKDKGAAEVDFTECTQNVTFYSATHSKMKRARFYDIPGCGTLSHQSESYYLDHGLCAFDCLVIMIDKTIGEDEVELARAAQNYGQGVVFVRSKCDIDLDAQKTEYEDEPIGPAEISAYLNKVRNAISTEIQTKCPDLSRIPCYFISAPTLREYVLGQTQTYVFQENLFIEYLILKSKHSRNIVF